MYTSDGSEDAFLPPELSQFTEYVFVEDVGLDSSHGLAVSEQDRAESVLWTVELTVRETGLCLAVVSPGYFPMDEAK